MKILHYLLFAGILLLACNPATKPTDEASVDTSSVAITDTVKDGIFIHITESYNDPHRVLMPLKMARMMAKDKDVLIYLDIHAVELVTKTSKDMEYADFDPLKKMLQDLIDANVGIYACPTCMKISNIKPEDLMNGIRVAEKEKFFNFTSGKIISLDY